MILRRYSCATASFNPLMIEFSETEQIPFSCKSRVCSSCGKVHAEEWARQVTSRLFNVIYRHITFTVADELWAVFEGKAEWRRMRPCGR